METLLSIKNQTFQDLEVLVMDGESRDDTVAIVEKMKLEYNSILCRVEKDNGVYDAMNKGIDLARGQFLYFMGSDDYFVNDTILAEVMQQTDGVDFLYGNVRFKTSGEVYSGESSLEKLVYRRTSICHQAIFYSKRVFELIGGYDQKYFIHADHDFNIKCFEDKRIKKKYIETIIAVFNEHGLSGLKSNEDGYKDVLTQRIIKNDKELEKISLERDKLKEQLAFIKESKSYKIGRKISSIFSFLKRRS